MKVKVLFFARSREVTGVSETEVELPPGATSAALLDQLLQTYPALEAVTGTCVLAVNQEYIAPGEAQPLKEGDELAVIPPISGG